MLSMRLQTVRRTIEIQRDQHKLVVVGSPFQDNGSCNLDELFSQLVQCSGIKSISEIIATLSGNFALVWSTPGKIFAACDLIRSIPLFYARFGTDLILSDSTNTPDIAKLASASDKDEVAEYQFKIAGYCLANRTRKKQIRQVEAGQIVEFASDSRLESQYYYSFRHAPILPPTNNYRTDFETTLVNAFHKTLEFAQGRQIVIPLSGGFDSRIVAILAKHLGATNVTTFTYGSRDSKETQYSKVIANSLGFKWHFIEYDRQIWKSYFPSSTLNDFTAFAHNETSLPHIQDFIAVSELKRRAAIENNAVFVPGHNVVSSGTYPSPPEMNGQVGEEQFLDVIFKKHLSNSPLISEHKPHLVRETQNDILKTIDSHKLDTTEGIYSALETWQSRERQAKYIANSVRTYEFFGYDWHLPLWDKNLAANWQQSTLEMRKQRAFFKQVVNQWPEKWQQKITLPEDNGASYSKKAQLARSITKLLPRPIFRMLKAKKVQYDLQNHPLGFQYTINENDQSIYRCSNTKLLGAMTDQFMNGKWDFKK